SWQSSCWSSSGRRSARSCRRWAMPSTPRRDAPPRATTAVRPPYQWASGFPRSLCHDGPALNRGLSTHREAASMALVHQFLAAIRRDEEGQGLAEYALILALIAIVAIIALIFLGGQVSKILSTVGNSVSPEADRSGTAAGTAGGGSAFPGRQLAGPESLRSPS